MSVVAVVVVVVVPYKSPAYPAPPAQTTAAAAATVLPVEPPQRADTDAVWPYAVDIAGKVDDSTDGVQTGVDTADGSPVEAVADSRRRQGAVVSVATAPSGDCPVGTVDMVPGLVESYQVDRVVVVVEHLDVVASDEWGECARVRREEELVACGGRWELEGHLVLHLQQKYNFNIKFS